MKLATRLLGWHSVPIVWTISELHLNVNVKNFTVNFLNGHVY